MTDQSKLAADLEQSRAREAKLREALEYAAMGLDRVHTSLTSNGPKQASGEMTLHFRDAARAALTPADDGWRPIETAPKNLKIIAGYFNELGNWRTIIACYHTQLPWSDEYDQESDSEYAPEGWYEECDSSEAIYPASCRPTHWRPLFAAPQEPGR